MEAANDAQFECQVEVRVVERGGGIERMDGMGSQLRAGGVSRGLMRRRAVEVCFC